MTNNIEKALISLGINEKRVPKILESVPQIMSDYEHNYSVTELKEIIETLLYIHIAQNIRDEGMWINENNCPEKMFSTLTKWNLIDPSQWKGRSVKTTRDGERFSRAIMEALTDNIHLEEMLCTKPQIIIPILLSTQMLPVKFLKKSYLLDSYESGQYFSSLPECNETVYEACSKFYKKAEKAGLAKLAHHYVSTRWSEERGEYYVLSKELMNKLKQFTAGEKSDKLEEQINEIKDNFYALKFLSHYSVTPYAGLGNYSHVAPNILIYLKELKGIINMSKNTEASDFSGSVPFIINDKDAYKARIEKYEGELNKQLTALFSEDRSKPSMGKVEGKSPKRDSVKSEPDPSQDVVPAIRPSDVIQETSSGNEIIIGSKKLPAQWGVIGKAEDSKLVKLDLNAPHVVFICGKMGMGKGYDIGVICEMLASGSILNISSVEKPGTVVVFYSGEPNIPSEFNMINLKNDIAREVEKLKDFGTQPEQLFADNKVKIFLDPKVYDEYRADFEDQYNLHNIEKIQIDSTTLENEDWGLSLSIGNNKALYLDQMYAIIRDLGKNQCNMSNIKEGVRTSGLTKSQKKLANIRLDIFRDYFLDNRDFLDDLVIGGINIFDLRRMMYTEDHIFAIMTLIVSRLNNRAKLAEKHGDSPVIFVINEAHKYLDPKKVSPEFVDKFIEIVKRKRHGGNWLLIDTHEPDEVHKKFVTHSDIKIIHHLDITLSAPEIKQAIKNASKSPDQLETGKAIISADNLLYGTQEAQYKPVIVNIRPRITKHGGATKTAIDDK